MPRIVLPESRIHPAIRQKVSEHQRDIVEECERSIASHDVVVIGMGTNVFPKRARKALTAKGVPFEYLEYGNYFGHWRRRNALKLWSGWPTFPMVFVKGTLIGGAQDLDALIANGEFDKLLATSP